MSATILKNMSGSMSSYAISLVAFKGLRYKEVKSRRRSSLFSWKKRSDDVSTVSGDESPHPSMRAVVSNRYDGVDVFSYSMEEVNRDEDGWITMDCVWPEGALLYISNELLDSKRELKLGLGLQVDNNQVVPLGNVTVSLLGLQSTYLSILPVKQLEEQITNQLYEFDVSSTRLTTVLDMIDENLKYVNDPSCQSFLSCSSPMKASVANIASDPTTSEYVQDDWMPFESDFETEQEAKIDDFSFEPVLVVAEQKVETNLTDIGRRSEDQSPLLDNNDKVMLGAGIGPSAGVELSCCDDGLVPMCIATYGDIENPSSGADETVAETVDETVDYPSSLLVLKEMAGEQLGDVEYTDDGVYTPHMPAITASGALEIIEDLSSLLKLKRKEKRKESEKGKSSSTVSTASTSSNSTNTMQDDKQGKYSQDFVPGCGFTLAGLVDLINIHPNCELCLEEFFDKDDDDSFASGSYYSVYDHASVNTDIVTNKKATYHDEGFSSLSRGSFSEQSHKEQIEMLAKSPLRRKRRLVYSLKRRAEV